ncbi:amidase [Ornithinibacillus sp. L9]|uniref:Amidase n=1 Tax=Ornithinibacillus caprae TaxID=2678566 RepID=A0A6N8FFE9_9BACI|nr:amidase [Ornithinibacillus caprae]MUK87426.1 amidase [Ornithinibacillus caprae]
MQLEQELLHLGIAELHMEYKKRTISPVEVTELLYKRIENHRDLNAFITLCKDDALEQARHAEKLYKNNDSNSMLLGIPIGLKDLIHTKGIKTTMASGVYQDFIPNEDAALVKTLLNMGSILIGKQNLHELAYGTTGDDSYFGPTRNPHDSSKIAGGSSSGSAAATAAQLCWGSIGTDTSGSIRIPASICGVVGMKPTYGKLDLEGIHPLSWTMDHVGLITRTVTDNAILYDGLCGTLGTSDSIYKKLATGILPKISSFKIGIPTDYYVDLDPEVEARLMKMMNHLENLGYTVVEVDLNLPDMNETMYISSAIDQAEAYLINREIVHEDSNDLGEETRKRILIGAKYKAYEFLLAQELKVKLSKTFEKAFQDVNVLLTPTIPILPPEFGQETVHIHGKTHNVRQALMRLTFISNYIGVPSISIPCGKSTEGLPIGMQLIGGCNQEEMLYQSAYLIDNAL